ncbi:DHA2 family efflux MFS transporter permease subunit [Solitalea lacus]|uniref:DHA2 family efflux MFS transporter permease subunit n=1 Tax=Solitalea lacus TaxID=2911172 RepID=UPI001EDB27AA|nr:DHA2 family efflux MFS transporter permease subunit [Solitalea lacus]UKJ05981.1 DHA2 family efflux MFS transporter permease subunit [Solitalea lacus]
MAVSGFKKWIVVVTVISAAMMELIDTSIVNVALSQMSGSLGASIEDIAWVITSYAIANVIIIPITGFLARYFGRKNYYLGSIILFTVASYFCGQSTNLWELVFFRFVQGIGGGALLSTSQAILFDNFKVEERPLASALFGMGVIMGPAFGPTLGGIIIDNYSWPLIFDINIPFGIIAAILVYFFVDKKSEEYNIDRKSIRIDIVGIVLLAVGVGALQFVLEKGESEDWFQTSYISWTCVLAIIGIIGFILWELKTDNPVVNIRVMQNKTLAFTTVLTFILGYGLFAAVFIYPVMVQRIMGYTPTMTGMSLIPGTLSAFFILPIIGKAMTKGVSPKVFISLGFVAYIVFTFWMGSFTAEASSGDFFLPLIFRGLGVALLTVPLTNQAIMGLAPKDIPQGIAINNMMRQLGGSFGIALTNTYVANRVAVHRNDLISNVTEGNFLASERINQLTQAFYSKGFSFDVAKNQAMHVLDGMVTKQAFLMSYLDAFRLVGLFFVICIPLILLVKKGKKPSEEAIKAAAEAAH